MSTVVLGVPGVWDVAKHFAAVDAATAHFTADGQRIAYHHPTLGPVFVAPSPFIDTKGKKHSVMYERAEDPKPVRWLYPLGSGPKAKAHRRRAEHATA